MMTAANNSHPLESKWKLHNVWVAGVIYQNIADASSHSLNVNKSVQAMWEQLTN